MDLGLFNDDCTLDRYSTDSLSAIWLPINKYILISSYVSRRN